MVVIELAEWLKYYMRAALWFEYKHDVFHSACKAQGLGKCYS